MAIVDRLFPRSDRSAPAPVPAAPPAGGTASPGAPTVVPAPSASAPAGGGPAPAQGAQPPRRADLEGLKRRRKQLSRELADRQWDLGGVTYEMAARDHFRLDVLVKLSAKLQQVDAELAEVERQLKLGEDAAAGNCPSCRAQYSRGAVFCWSCGHQLLEIQQQPG